MALAVDGQSVPFSYDLDGLLTQAGSLSMTRDAQHGLLTNTILGNATTLVPAGQPAHHVAYTPQRKP